MYMYIYTCLYLNTYIFEMKLTCPLCYDTVSEQERAEVPHIYQKRPIYIKKRRMYMYIYTCSYLNIYIYEMKLTCPLCYDTVSEQERAEEPKICQKRPIYIKKRFIMIAKRRVFIYIYICMYMCSYIYLRNETHMSRTLRYSVEQERAEVPQIYQKRPICIEKRRIFIHTYMYIYIYMYVYTK